MENSEKRSRCGLVRMIRGLAQPENTRAYKEARIALERLSAPLVAVLVPVLAAVVLAVVTAMRPKAVSVVEIQVVDIVDDVPEPEPPPPIDEPNMTADEPTVDVALPGAPVVAEVPVPEPAATASAEPVKDLKNAVLPVVSPVRIRRVNSAWAVRTKAGREQGLGTGAEQGDGRTEESVLKALRWLKYTQRPDGSWAGPSPTAMAGLAEQKAV